MKMKKILAIVAAAALSLSATVFAAPAWLATADASAVGDVPAITESFAKERPVLTDEQKAEMEARHQKMTEAQSKWGAVTDAQKEEIYALKDKAIDVDAQIIDKYLEWGVIDSDTGAEMKSRLSDRKTQMRDSGRMPGFGGKGGRGHKGMPPQGAPDSGTQNGAVTTTSLKPIS